MKRLDSKCGCLLISSNRKLCNFFYVRGRRNIAFDVLSVVLMLLFALPLLRKCKWRPGPESKEIKSRLSTQLVTAFTIQLSDVPRKLSDEVTENIYSPEVTACSPISRTTFIQNYYHALEHILLLY